MVGDADRHRRSSTGWCHASGRSATPGSRGRTARGSSTSPTRRCTCSATARRSTRRRPRGLREHLFTRPERPRPRPYRTSYWTEQWGFCMSRRGLESLDEGDYQVLIDATLDDGLSPRRAGLEGAPTTNSCSPRRLPPRARERQPLGHRRPRGRWRGRSPRGQPPAHLPPPLEPGHARAALLAPHEPRARRPGSARPRDLVRRRPGPVRYKRSRRGDAAVDRAAGVVLRDAAAHRATGRRTAATSGSSARPASTCRWGRFSRTPRRFPEYHSSADDLNLVTQRPSRLLHARARDHRRPRGDERSSTRRRTASRSSAGAGSTALSAAARARKRRSSGC